MAAEGISPASLLAPSATATPDASPASSLLLGLTPATAGPIGGLTYTPAAGLARPASASVPHPLPLGSGGLGPLPGVSQSAPVSPALAPTGFGRLPDTLYAESPTSGAGGSGVRLGGPSRLAGAGGGGGTSLSVNARPFTFGGGSGGGAFAPGLARTDSSGGPSPSASSQLRVPSPGLSPLGGGSSFGSGSSASGLAASAPSFSPGPPPSSLHMSPAGRGLSGSLGSGGSTNASPSTAPAFGAGLVRPMQPPPSPAVVSALAQPRLPPQLGSATVGPPGLQPSRQAGQGSSEAASSVVQLPGMDEEESDGAPAGPERRCAACCCLGRPLQRPLPAAPAHSAALPPAPPGLKTVPPRAAAAEEGGDLRSFFGSVIGLTPVPAEPAGPLSVEEVRRKLALLPAGQAVADVAGGWLAGWDAAAAAQLLLLLDSPTTTARALQLFEWLRGLPADSPHAHLCSPEVYAAMIGLYGRWRKPKAVSLLACLASAAALPCMCPLLGLHCTAPPARSDRRLLVLPWRAGGAPVCGAEGARGGQRRGALGPGGGFLQVRSTQQGFAMSRNWPAAGSPCSAACPCLPHPQPPATHPQTRSCLAASLQERQGGCGDRRLQAHAVSRPGARPWGLPRPAGAARAAGRLGGGGWRAG